MKRIVLSTLAIPIIGIGGLNPVKADVPDDVAERCMKATDFRGCVGALTGAPIRVDQTHRPGLLQEMGNECPALFAYVGAGNCQEVTCIGASGNHPLLAGKGWSCPKHIFGRYSLSLGNTIIRASHNPSCPQRPPVRGYSSSCSDPLASGGATNSQPSWQGKSKDFRDKLESFGGDDNRNLKSSPANSGTTCKAPTILCGF